MNKFSPLSKYQVGIDQGYQLLPFRFSKLDEERYVLTNIAGEYLVAGRGDIEDLVKHRLSSSTQFYGDLKSKHFLRDASSDIAMDLLPLKVRTKFNSLTHFTGLHMMVTSLRCDHSCLYCQVSRQSEDKLAFDMSEETADNTLKLIFRSPSPAIKIEFQGGESLINFEIIKYVVEKALEINEVEKRDLEFVIATNLVFINDEILSFCRLHKILISTSLDGPEDLHNKNRLRPGNNSYQLTIEGIAKAREALGQDRVGALMTTTADSLTRAKDIVDEYVKHNFDGIFLRPLSPYGFAIKTSLIYGYDTEQWLEFYFEALDYIIELNKSGHFFVEQNAAIILSKILTPFDTGYVDLMSPAGIGIAAVIYDYDGDVYASDESRMLAKMDDKTFKLGNVNSSSYEDIFLAEPLLEALEDSFAYSAPMCHDCAYEPFCGADPVFHHGTTGDFVGRKPTSPFCKRNMAIFQRLIQMIEADDEIRRIFNSWIAI